MIRIVKLTFEPEHIAAFLAHFETVKEKINAFEGCQGMQLLQSKKEPNVVFTYSKWNSEDDLNNYRNSALFAAIWPKVKTWFSAKPEAWSTDCYFDGFEMRG